MPSVRWHEGIEEWRECFKGDAPSPCTKFLSPINNLDCGVKCCSSPSRGCMWRCRLRSKTQHTWFVKLCIPSVWWFWSTFSAFPMWNPRGPSISKTSSIDGVLPLSQTTLTWANTMILTNTFIKTQHLTSYLLFIHLLLLPTSLYRFFKFTLPSCPSQSYHC